MWSDRPCEICGAGCGGACTGSLEGGRRLPLRPRISRPRELSGPQLRTVDQIEFITHYEGALSIKPAPCRARGAEMRGPLGSAFRVTECAELAQMRPFFAFLVKLQEPGRRGSRQHVGLCLFSRSSLFCPLLLPLLAICLRARAQSVRHGERVRRLVMNGRAARCPEALEEAALDDAVAAATRGSFNLS